MGEFSTTARDGHLFLITINRPEKMNAFRGRTCDELIHALIRAGYAADIGVIVLAGAGDKAFCTGGDQSAHAGQYDGRGTIGLPMEELHGAIRDVPKPVIARLSGLLSEIARSPEVRQRLYQQGWQVAGGSSEALARRIAADTAAMGRIIAERGIKVE